MSLPASLVQFANAERAFDFACGLQAAGPGSDNVVPGIVLRLTIRHGRASEALVRVASPTRHTEIMARVPPGLARTIQTGQWVAVETFCYGERDDSSKRSATVRRHLSLHYDSSRQTWLTPWEVKALLKSGQPKIIANLLAPLKSPTQRLGFVIMIAGIVMWAIGFAVLLATSWTVAQALDQMVRAATWHDRYSRERAPLVAYGFLATSFGLLLAYFFPVTRRRLMRWIVRGPKR